MSLCSLCLTIPLQSLPDPIIYGVFLINDDPLLPQIELDIDLNLFAWHPSVVSLALSAPTCSLCWLVDQAYQQWIKRLDEATARLSSRLQRDDLEFLRPGHGFWLARRFNGATSGLLVLLDGPKKNPTEFPVLTGVGFSAETCELCNKRLLGNM